MFDELRCRLKDLGCDKIDDLTDDELQDYLHEMSLAFTAIGQGLRDLIVVSVAFLKESGAIDLKEELS